MSAVREEIIHQIDDMPIGAVMVVGGGIAGIQSALDLANSGFKVYLVEKSPTIGGKMAQLDKTFPTGDCATCIVSPKLVEAARNLNIEIITNAQLEEFDGKPGHFKVRIREKARYIDVNKCNSCGDCEKGLSRKSAGQLQSRPQYPRCGAQSNRAGSAECLCYRKARKAAVRICLSNGAERSGLRCPDSSGQVCGGCRAD